MGLESLHMGNLVAFELDIMNFYNTIPMEMCQKLVFSLWDFEIIYMQNYFVKKFFKKELKILLQ